jgi:hypothetical protein
MSRALWDVEIKIRCVNGQSGAVHLMADKLVTQKEIREVLDKAASMAAELARDPAEETAPAWRPSVVGQGRA